MAFRRLILIVLLSLSGAASASAQAIDVEMQIYRGGATIIDALQAKLLEGGEAAVSASAQLPRLAGAGQISLEEELAFQTASGQISKHASSSDKLTVNREVDHQVVDGLEIELDPVVSGDGQQVDINLVAEWSRKVAGDVRISRSILTMAMPSGVPVLMQRWSEGEDIYLMMIRATAAGVVSQAPPVGAVLYLDAAAYASAEDVSGGRAPMTHMVLPTRSGQRVKVEVGESVYFDIDGGLEMVKVGLSAEIDATLDADGETVELAAAVSWSEGGSGSERTADGDRVPRIAFHDLITHNQRLRHGHTASLPMTTRSLADRNPQASDAQAVLKLLIYGAKPAE